LVLKFRSSIIGFTVLAAAGLLPFTEANAGVSVTIPIQPAIVKIWVMSARKRRALAVETLKKPLEIAHYCSLWRTEERSLAHQRK